MSLKDISPDGIVFWEWGPVKLNATIVFTWIVMAMLTLGSWLITRKISTSEKISRWHNLLEVMLEATRKQIREVSQEEPDKYLPFIGTLFIFILVSNLLALVPGFIPPTSSLSTTAGLALCVFVAVQYFGILQKGLKGYLKNFIEPTPFMLPFNIIGELSRTLALAIRLFGNIMSGSKIAAILLAVAPLVFPVVMHALGILTGAIQAYIFAILAIVYIASGTKVKRDEYEEAKEEIDSRAAGENSV
ncbi:MAG: F0F1 ATP synthase subunit A [Vulcanimicrobiota bacterium]